MNESHLCQVAAACQPRLGPMLLNDGMAVNPCTIMMCAAACQTCATPHRLLMCPRSIWAQLIQHRAPGCLTNGCPSAHLLEHLNCGRADCCRAVKRLGTANAGELTAVELSSDWTLLLQESCLL